MHSSEIVSAPEPRSGDVVDNPRRPQGAAGTRCTPPNIGAAERAMSSDGHTQGMRRWWGQRRKRGKDNIAAPQLSPYFVTHLPLASLLRCGRQGLSTTSPLRGSQTATCLSTPTYPLHTATQHSASESRSGSQANTSPLITATIYTNRHPLRGATDSN